MAAPARSATQAARTLSHQAAAPLRPRRANKRTARSSPSAALESLTQLYHLTPTFTPTASPSTLSSHLESTLLVDKKHPVPIRLGDILLSQINIDRERVALSTGSATTSIHGLNLKASPTHNSLLTDEHPFDHRESFFSSYTLGAEPPLAQRVRRIIDAVHGTTAGGRAGAHTLRESGEKAKVWREGLEKAREQARLQEVEQERDAEDFARAFAEEEVRRS